MMEFLFGYAVGSMDSKNKGERSGGGGYALLGFMMMLGIGIILMFIYQNTPIKPVLEETSKDILGSADIGIFGFPIEGLFPLILYTGGLSVVFTIGYIIYKIKK